MTVSIPMNETGKQVQKKHDENQRIFYLNLLREERDYIANRLEWLNKEIEKEEKEIK